MEWLHDIVDKSLKKMSEEEMLMHVSSGIPSGMKDSSGKESNDWSTWKPINSIIEDVDIEKVEKEIGYSLPPSYKAFLQYKHFVELRIPDFLVHFPGNFPDKEITFLKEMVFEIMEPELIIDKGYIHFATFSDFGLLCFDTNKKVDDHEYNIVYIDHELLEETHLYATSFKELLLADEDRGNRFIEYLNNLNS